MAPLACQPTFVIPEERSDEESVVIQDNIAGSTRFAILYCSIFGSASSTCFMRRALTTALSSKQLLNRT